MGEINRSDLAYGGKYHKYGWTKEYNLNATIANCLANCTTLVIMMCWIMGLPLPVDSIPSASIWHLHLVNGWKRKDFNRNDLKPGDIVQWVNRCHVAIVDKVVNGTVYLHCSWYTGQNGKSKSGSGWDPRTKFSSLKEVSDFMFSNYAYRTYHYCTLDEEIKGAGGEPENILYLNVAIEPDGEDSSKDQIEVLTNVQNVRTSPEVNDTNIEGSAKGGFYDVYDQIENDGYTWYKVKGSLYIAGVAGRVNFIPAQGSHISDLRKILNSIESEFETMSEKIKIQEDLINQIHEMTKPKGE